MSSAVFKRYFLTGLLVVTPIWGTVLVLKTLFVTVDSILGNMLAEVVTEDYYVPGLGILTLLFLILFAGFMGTNYIGGRLVKRWEESVGTGARGPGDLRDLEIDDGYPVVQTTEEV